MQESTARANGSKNCKGLSKNNSARKKQAREPVWADEKKEDPILNTMASDEDWLDEVVSTKVADFDVAQWSTNF